jgi:hypothetical protein
MFLAALSGCGGPDGDNGEAEAVAEPDKLQQTIYRR